MLEKVIKKYTAKRLENLNQLLSKPISKSTVDTLHQIRIEIKKLFALKRFLEHRNIKFLNKKTSSELDELFSKSGKIREIQVALDLIKLKFTEIRSHEIIGFLKKEVEIRKADFINKYNGYLIETRNVVVKNIDVNETTLKNYITILKNTRSSISKGPKALPSMIHNIRVNLKDANYLSKLLLTKKVNINDMKFILELGEWHDYVSLRKIIFKILAANELNELNTSQLISVIQKINRKIKIDLEHMKNNISTYVNKS